jgi:hypothetical protein
VPVDETGLSVPEPERVRRKFGLPRSDRRHGDLRFGVSRSTFFLAEIAVELAEQGIAVFLGPVGLGERQSSRPAHGWHRAMPWCQ